MRRTIVASMWASLPVAGFSSQGLWCAAIAQVTRFAELPADAPGTGRAEGDHLAVGLTERRLQRDRRPILCRGVPADREEVRLRHHRVRPGGPSGQPASGARAVLHRVARRRRQPSEEVRKKTRVSARYLPNLSCESGPGTTSSLRISGSKAMLFMVMSITPRAQKQEGRNR